MCANAVEPINQTVWKMLFGVTDTQVNDAQWLARDDDGDGISNGAEIAAGTNPFSAGSAIKISSISSDASYVYISYPSVAGKQYVVQTSTSLGTSAIWSVLSPSVYSTGDGSTQTLIAPNTGANVFFRVLVQDVDTDGDGVSDWAERATGFNPNSGSSDGSHGDLSSITGALGAENTVTITTTKATATQPVDSITPATDLATVTITRSGTLHFNSVTVNLAKSGSAVEGTDYTSLPASVTFSPRTSSITLTVVPKAAPTRKTNTTAIVKLLAGSGYTMGGSTSAAVVINPTIANGTGLTGQYQNSSSSTYSSQTTIFSSAVEMTRTDATIDFASGVNGWGAVAGPTGMSSASTNGAFSVRWTGQVLPQYSETYYFDMYSDDGAKVWVNGVLLIDKWQTQGVTDNVNAIALKAGVLYDIQVEYFNSSTGTARAHLYWWSPSQTKQIIPQSRLFPPPALAQKGTPVTTPLNAYGYVSVPFSLAATSPSTGGATTYAIPSDSAPLPPGLSLNTTTGMITGTPTTAGTYTTVVNALNSAASGAVTGSSVITFTIYPSGSVSREILTATGSKVSDIVIPAGTPTHDSIATVDDDVDYPANTGERLRGYVVPPKTGNYYFWLAANNAAELWISNDSEYVNKVRRATVTASTDKMVWNNQASQQSAWIALEAGQKYYFEVLHNTGADSDSYVEMGWCQDDVGTVMSVAGAPNATGAVTVIPNGSGGLQGYPLSGGAPSYLFQAYDYPALAAITGTLYSANLGPQGSSATKASGSASLLVASGGASAILHFAYSGLTSPRTAYHLHVDGYDSHPAGEIIYDIDDIDSFHPDLRTADGGYIWNFGAVGSFTSAAQILDGIQRGKVYLNIHSVTFPAGEIRGNLTVVSGSQTPPVASAYTEPSPTDVASNVANATRFLNQATFGASPSDITDVGTRGFSGWIDNQLTLAPSHMSDDVVAGLTADINQPYPSALFTNTWWKYSINGPDQLRQRLAFALSEILVVSWNNDSGPLAFNGRILADYYDQLVDYCLPTPGITNSGSFRGILKNVTLTPAMGLYLDMRGNQKGDDTIGRHPNENYAREIMQLFSVGIYRQWDDGKFILDSNANLPATYTQPSILGVAALLTGWNYNQANLANGRAPSSFSPAADYLNAMVLVPTQHDLGPKLLLNNVVTPAATGRLPRLAITSIGTGASTSLITTAANHGLTTGDTVTIYNVTSGTFTGGLAAINASFSATVVSPTTFTVPVACSVASSGSGTITGATVLGVGSAAFTINALTATNPCKITTTAANGLRNGDMVTISGVTTGAYTGGLTAINATYPATVVTTTSFTVPVICTTAGTNGTATNLLGSSGFPLAGFAPVPGSQADNAGTTLPHPYDQYGLKELDTVIDNIVDNDNVPPYICRQLIQRLVTSNPSPGYLYRVVQKFKDNGSGVRGDMTAVVKQILLDGEARSTTAAFANASFGKQREPMLRLTGPARAFPASAYTGTYQQLSGVDSNKFRITTTATNDFNSGFSVSLDFRSNYTSTVPPTPYTNPTTASYAITATQGIASVATDMSTAFDISSISTGNPTTITTVQPHGLTGTAQVWIFGACGTFSSTINGTALTATVTGTNTFTVPINTTRSFQILSISTGNPCTVTTTAPHGFTGNQTVTINGVTGGTFSSAINANFTATNTGLSTFTVPSNCTVVPTGYPSRRVSNTPTKVTTVQAHGLTTGDAVVISNVSGGSFSPTINGSFAAVVLDPTAFAVSTYSATTATAGTGQIAGSNVLDVAATSMVNVTYTQVAGSATMTVNTAGPPTDVAIPNPNSGTTTLKSRVYLKFLTQTTAGGAAIAADGIYDVQTVNGTTSFTVNTADTPVTARGGNVIIPKITSSYTPQTSNTVLQFNNNTNHNMLTTQHVWVDAPVVVGPVTDGEYVITSIVDEDHFKTSYLPVSSSLGTYPLPTGGSNNSVILWPLVPPPLGRSGNVTINSSTFNINSTESTLTQTPLNSPTVFNYYFPNYKFPGTLSNTGTDSPEFQLTTDTNVANLTNSITNMFIGTGGANSNTNGLSSFNNGSGTVVMDIGEYMTAAQVANGAIPALIDTLAARLVGGPLEAATKTTIQNFVANNTNFPLTTPTATATQRRDRVRAIVHLILTSAEYAVQK